MSAKVSFNVIVFEFTRFFGAGLNSPAFTLCRLCLSNFGRLGLPLLFLSQCLLLQCHLVFLSIFCHICHLSPPCCLLLLRCCLGLFFLGHLSLFLIRRCLLLDYKIAIIFIDVLAPFLEDRLGQLVEFLDCCAPQCLRALLQRVVRGQVMCFRCAFSEHDRAGSVPPQA
ncbi:hypothetical protein B0H34DRAFT_119774 [Crassisporium funariophilum]|nr:hypothetical protein B0H34DRAFT_119774 [Crassisporium funariophilum]